MIINVLWGHLLCGIIFFWYIMGKAALCVERESHVKDSYYGCPLFRFAESAFHDPFYLIFAS